MKKILFVCLGNICRSPAAEGILKSRIKKAKLEKKFYIDSAGTSAHHEGELADARMRHAASRRGYELDSLSRPLVVEDFEQFDHILVMDRSNYDNVLSLLPSKKLKSKVEFVTDYCTRHKVDEVPDPYWSGARGFELVLDILEDAIDQFLIKVKGGAS